MKRAAFDAGLIDAADLHTPWKTLRKRLEKNGVDVVRLGGMSDAVHSEAHAAPPRAPWHDFPEVPILAPVPAVKQHPSYAAAKGGDMLAALELARDFLTPSAIEDIRRLILRPGNTVLLPVLAVEQSGKNMIPLGMARVLERALGIPVEMSIFQVNRVSHTGSSGWHRLTHPAVFDGPVKKGVEYLIVDDFIGQGGTIANLRGHVVAHGGGVVGAAALTGKPYSAKMSLTKETLEQLRDKHGQELETLWRELTGHGLEYLTESEARYLHRADDVEQIRARILEAGDA